MEKTQKGQKGELTTAPIGKDPDAITTESCPFGLHNVNDKATPHRQIGSWAKSWVETTSNEPYRRQHRAINGVYRSHDCEPIVSWAQQTKTGGGGGGGPTGRGGDTRPVATNSQISATTHGRCSSTTPSFNRHPIPWIVSSTTRLRRVCVCVCVAPRISAVFVHRLPCAASVVVGRYPPACCSSRLPVLLLRLLQGVNGAQCQQLAPAVLWL
jgi:hypothetical protein